MKKALKAVKGTRKLSRFDEISLDNIWTLTIENKTADEDNELNEGNIIETGGRESRFVLPCQSSVSWQKDVGRWRFHDSSRKTENSPALLLSVVHCQRIQLSATTEHQKRWHFHAFPISFPKFAKYSTSCLQFIRPINRKPFRQQAAYNFMENDNAVIFTSNILNEIA